MAIPELRYYPDTDAEKLTSLAHESFRRSQVAGDRSKISYFLAISGGGDDGAFGAGLLNGWSTRGDRPAFKVVTGVSTGALSAPFAFLGSEYDDRLKRVYTDTSAADVFEKRSLMAAVSDDALTDTAPLRALIARYVDVQLVQRIAQEYSKGRLLLVMTTNLDQGRAVIWNIGAIASSGNPKARDLIIDILRASASLPGVFPPVMLDVTIEGKRYQEMHVDGGAVAQAFLYPPGLNLAAESAKRGVRRKRIAFIIRNGRLYRPEVDVKRQTLAIATQAIATMTASSGINDTYRMFLTTQRDQVDFNLAYIGDEFQQLYKGPFDKAYMRMLFNFGYQHGRGGYPWMKAPPGYAK